MMVDLQITMVEMDGCKFCKILKPMVASMLEKYKLDLIVVQNTSLTPEERKNCPILPHFIFRKNGQILTQIGGIPKGMTMADLFKTIERMVLMNILKKTT